MLFRSPPFAEFQTVHLARHHRHLLRELQIPASPDRWNHYPRHRGRGMERRRHEHQAGNLCQPAPGSLTRHGSQRGPRHRSISVPHVPNRFSGNGLLVRNLSTVVSFGNEREGKKSRLTGGGSFPEGTRPARRPYLLGCGVYRRYGLTARWPLGNLAGISSSFTAGTMIQSSPSFQLAGVAT